MIWDKSISACFQVCRICAIRGVAFKVYLKVALPIWALPINLINNNQTSYINVTEYTENIRSHSSKYAQCASQCRGDSRFPLNISFSGLIPNWKDVSSQKDMDLSFVRLPLPRHKKWETVTHIESECAGYAQGRRGWVGDFKRLHSLLLISVVYLVII